MDISGEKQSDCTHNLLKTRLDERGALVPESVITELLKDLDRINEQGTSGCCGSRYGEVGPEGVWCKPCDEVRQAYLNVEPWMEFRPARRDRTGESNGKHTRAFRGCNSCTACYSASASQDVSA